ncbi:NUDIX hydrolase domain-like protein [Boeremia exigua]|uniref:NUDIX hydrolase domain-like protein n=1 Tax=Boeremia exigua TaxID=749465 RepID=UPI001E8DDB8B|nr:NUDIX hydrolase domain-like protein [Boeremia exigua]KAH6625872.1 NUDIX hydrolase domain-like protein [Boeremia exigua]
MTSTTKPSSNPSKVLKTEPLDHKDAKWATLTSITFLDPSGNQRRWESASRLTRPAGSSIDAVGVAAILHDPAAGSPRIVLQKQWRAPAEAVVIEIPAGLMDEGETAGECAVRELREETGYVGRVMEGEFGVSPVMFNDPGFCNTNLKMVQVEVDMALPENQDPKPQLEPGEFIETFTVPLTDLYAECVRFEKEGYVLDARVGTLAQGVEFAKRWKLA